MAKYVFEIISEKALDKETRYVEVLVSGGSLPEQPPVVFGLTVPMASKEDEVFSRVEGLVKAEEERIKAARKTLGEGAKEIKKSPLKGKKKEVTLAPSKARKK